MASKAKPRSLDNIRFATLHHSAVNPGAKNRQELLLRAKIYDKYHGEKSYALITDGELGYPTISYHFMIAQDGTVIQTQDIKWPRYHTSDSWRGPQSHNTNGIAILLDGNFDEEIPPKAQLDAAVKLIGQLNKQLGRKLIVSTHREQADPHFFTSCPGNNMGLTTQLTSKTRYIIDRVDGKLQNSLQIGAIIAGIIAIIIGFLFEEKKVEEDDVLEQEQEEEKEE